MKLVNLSCPNCGSVMSFDKETKECVCNSCGGSFLVDDEATTQEVKYVNAHEAGYEFELGRQQARAESIRRADSKYVTTQPSPKRRTWLWVMGWIFIFPIPLTILLVRNKSMNKVLKYTMISLAWVTYLLIGLIAGNDTSTDNSVGNSWISDSVETSSTVETQEIDRIGDFITSFNSISETQIVNTVRFDPQDKSSGYYRTEFRLNAWKDSLGVVGDVGNAQIIVVNYNRNSSYTSDHIRVYVSGADEAESKVLMKDIMNILDPTLSSDEIDKNINHVVEYTTSGSYGKLSFYFIDSFKDDTCEFMVDECK